MRTLRKIRKKYNAPTPKKWRQIGNALLGVSAMGVPAVLMSYTWVGITLFIIGIAGKFITNFFSTDETI